MKTKEKIRIILVHIIVFILSIWPVGIFSVFIAGITYCKIEDCSGYNEGRIGYAWIGGVILFNILFHLSYMWNYKKHLV